MLDRKLKTFASRQRYEYFWESIRTISLLTYNYFAMNTRCHVCLSLKVSDDKFLLITGWAGGRQYPCQPAVYLAESLPPVASLDPPSWVQYEEKGEVRGRCKIKKDKNKMRHVISSSRRRVLATCCNLRSAQLDRKPLKMSKTNK